MNRMRQRKVRNDRALAIIRNLEEFQEDDAIKIADGHAKPAAKKVSFFFISRDDDEYLARFLFTYNHTIFTSISQCSLC